MLEQRLDPRPELLATVCSWLSKRATVGIATRTGPRNASIGVAAPSAASSSPGPERGAAAPQACLACASPCRAWPRLAAPPSYRPGARARDPGAARPSDPPARARRSSSRARRSRCRCSRAGRPSPRGRRDAPARGRRSRRSRAVRARRATSARISLRARSPSPPRNHSLTGAEKPCFGRWTISGGSSPATAFFEEVLALAVADLHLGRQRERELDELVVEKRHARLDRVRHRHLVDAHQEQLGEPLLQLEVGHLLEQVGAGARARPRARSARRPRTSRDAPRPLREHPVLERALVRDRAAPERDPARGRLLDRLGVRHARPVAQRERP